MRRILGRKKSTGTHFHPATPTTLPTWRWERGQSGYKLTKIDEVFTEFEPALLSITTPVPGNMREFVNLLQGRLDEQLETPPNNKTIEKPF
jgi:hypothetical protein